ncbi:MAG: acetamidase/formamidase family protein [Candidatus Dormibacteraeota bacterium]|nr:acetamidase/formamidase family protein [Candidatus Dormibacteraeota bacterium]
MMGLRSCGRPSRSPAATARTADGVFQEVNRGRCARRLPARRHSPLSPDRPGPAQPRNRIPGAAWALHLVVGASLAPAQAVVDRVHRPGCRRAPARARLRVPGVQAAHAPLLTRVPRGDRDVPVPLDAHPGGEATGFKLPRDAVAVPGALFHIGDGHATQGDGEIVGTGIEVSFDVQFTCRVRKDARISWPRGENREFIFTVGNARPLDQAVQHATTEMLRWLSEDYGLDPRAAGTLMGQAVRYDLGNVFDPAYTMVCKLPKELLPGHS